MRLCVLVFLSMLCGGVTAGESKGTILFLGDSLSAGYGLDKNVAFPALIQARLDEEGLEYRVVNAGVSGDTTAGGLRRLNWILKQHVDVLVLELGANDGLRGVPVRETMKNLQEIIDRTKARYPDVKIVIAGMMVPPNLGGDYGQAFQELFPALANRNDAVLIPFLLENVAGNPGLNLADGIHPTEEGHAIIAETVWIHLRPLL